MLQNGHTCAVQGPDVEMTRLSECQAEGSPGKRLEHIGWGGNLRAMRTRSEEVHDLDHTPFRPTLLSEPGSRSACPPAVL